MTFTIGSFTPSAPVVLAPMAGVTNAPFRALCRRFAPGLVYVNEMVMATPVVHGNPKTHRMISFGDDEHPRSLQLYGSDPEIMGRAVHQLCDAGRIDHLDLNFGCPAAKVTRRGGGAAVAARPELLRAILRAAVRAAAPYGVPVTAKFRMGLFDDWLTHVRTGEICAEEGVAAIALHARTVEQHYAGDARWEAISELKQKRLDAAMADANRAGRDAPEVFLARMTAGQSLVAGKRFDDALPHAEAAAKLLPDSAQAHLVLGIALENLGRRDEAVGSYETARRLDPEGEIGQAADARLRRLGAQR